MAAKVTFDGSGRYILLEPGVDTLDVESELYSEWKRWSSLEINLKYLGAFRTFGGDQTIAGQFAPKYFFLTNGWRIIVDNGVDLLVGTNLYTDELDSPFLVFSNSTVSLNNSDAAVVDTGISQNLDYGGVVYINPSIGFAGTSYPIGTLAKPVNNVSDAKIIADLYGIRELHIFGHIIVDIDLENFIVFGGNLNDVVTIQNVSCDKTTFKQCLLEGSYTGEIAADNCIINDGFLGMNGYFQYCGFMGSMYFSPNSECVLNDCHSQVAGTSSPSLYLNTGVSLSLRKYSGGLAVYNSSAGTICTLEFLVGNCRLLTGNTGGQIVIRGLATLTDNSSGTQVLTEGMIIPNEVPSISQLSTVNENVKKASLLIPATENLIN
jgi:hypothetical protein